MKQEKYKVPRRVEKLLNARSYSLMSREAKTELKFAVQTWHQNTDLTATGIHRRISSMFKDCPNSRTIGRWLSKPRSRKEYKRKPDYGEILLRLVSLEDEVVRLKKKLQ